MKMPVQSNLLSSPSLLSSTLLLCRRLWQQRRRRRRFALSIRPRGRQQRLAVIVIWKFSSQLGNCVQRWRDTFDVPHSFFIGGDLPPKDACGAMPERAPGPH